MTQITVESVHAVEILDSRGRPTLAVTLTRTNGRWTRAGVPSGASTGAKEAVELRDGGTTRFGGQGVRAAVSNVNGAIHEALSGRSFDDIAQLDRALLKLDGTPNKSGLGANAVVGVSMAAARAFADAASLPLWRYLNPDGVVASLPVPHFNVINGGAHANNPLDFQEFMIAPLGAPSYAEAVRAGAEIYQRLRSRLIDEGRGAGLGDEGGFAPDLETPEAALELLVGAITAAGYDTGRGGVAIALDPAANGFYADGAYRVAGRELSSDEMIDYLAELADRFPIWSIEDGLAEDDWAGWERLTDRLGQRLQIVGDDIFVTDPATITRGIELGVGNAALIKVNQIGTVSETLTALETCRRAGYAAMISHRSGETEDTFIADLAVGSGCGQMKSGAPARGERVAKYNRILEIADARPELVMTAP